MSLEEIPPRRHVRTGQRPSFARTPRAKAVLIDVERALTLWGIYKNWATVAEHMLRADNRPFTPMSVYMAVWRANRLPEGSKRQRPTGEERDMSETSLSHIWHPGKEKWQPRRPCYRTNRIVASAPRAP